MSKIIFASILLFFTNALQAADQELEGNLLSKEQISKIDTQLSQWIDTEAKKQGLSHDQYVKLASTDQEALNAFIKETNGILAEIKAPQIGKIKTNQFKVAQINGFVGSTVKGISFLDGKNVFCFPCEIGYNSFSYGIFSGKKLKIPSASRKTLKIDKKHVGKPVPIEGSPDPK